MGNLDKNLLNLLSTSLFQKIANNEVLRIAQLNATTSLLIKNSIPYDLSFSPGTRRLSRQVSLTIYINPNTQLLFTIVLDEGLNPPPLSP